MITNQPEGLLLKNTAVHTGVCRAERLSVSQTVRLHHSSYKLNKKNEHITPTSLLKESGVLRFPSVEQKNRSQTSQARLWSSDIEETVKRSRGTKRVYVKKESIFRTIKIFCVIFIFRRIKHIYLPNSH